MTNPIVFMDFSLGGTMLGRVKMELHANICPTTSENFRQLCTGECRVDGKLIGYKNTQLLGVTKGFLIQGGDFENMDGTGTQSIYGGVFRDENFVLKHDEFVLSMMPSKSGCIFFITLAKCEFLDTKQVVFGKIVDGFQVLRQIEMVKTKDSKPKIPVLITECGEM